MWRHPPPTFKLHLSQHSLLPLFLPSINPNFHIWRTSDLWQILIVSMAIHCVEVLSAIVLKMVNTIWNYSGMHVITNTTSAWKHKSKKNQLCSSHELQLTCFHRLKSHACPSPTLTAALLLLLLWPSRLCMVLKTYMWESEKSFSKWESEMQSVRGRGATPS